MSKLRLTPEDHLRGKVIPPGWYPVEVVNVEEKPAKSDGSTNWSIECKVIDGELKGVVLYTNFNEKAPGFAKNFIVASGVKKEFRFFIFDSFEHGNAACILHILVTTGLVQFVRAQPRSCCR